MFKGTCRRSGFSVSYFILMYCGCYGIDMKPNYQAYLADTTILEVIIITVKGVRLHVKYEMCEMWLVNAACSQTFECVRDCS